MNDCSIASRTNIARAKNGVSGHASCGRFGSLNRAQIVRNPDAVRPDAVAILLAAAPFEATLPDLVAAVMAACKLGERDAHVESEHRQQNGDECVKANLSGHRSSSFFR